jgi:hypothetical protein
MAAQTTLLPAVLRRRGIRRAADLAEDLGTSQPTLSRLVRSLHGRVIAIGKARRTRYALVRDVRALQAELPVFRVDMTGRPRRCATLRMLDPEGAYLEFAAQMGWPLDDTMRDGLFPGLPYFIADARPQGFLGRAFARAHGPRLNVPIDPTRWSDDDVLVALALAGEDVPGDLIVGEASLESFQRRRAEGLTAIPAAARERAYPRRAAAALLGEAPGSSAGGEFAKFTAAVGGKDGIRHVIVKFSPADDAPASTRWRDLLVAEHHAAAALAHAGVPAVHSELVYANGRTFLEVTRFDRVGEYGRRAVVSLGSVEPALLGLGEVRWERAATALSRRGWLSSEDARRVAVLALFGELIGNTDMHPGNLAFLQAGESGFALAPAYDMLPMLFAPARSGELVARRLTPVPPSPEYGAEWHIALAAASNYWETLAADKRASDAFRRISSDNVVRIREIGERFR